MGYRSRIELLGLPLIHVTTGRIEDGTYRRGIARGWIAIGGVAVGGAALGALALGGLAVGVQAAGGAAVALVAALGGLAVARDVALGGAAVAQHANDAVAREMMADGLFFRAAELVLDYAIVLVALPILMGLGRWRSGRARDIASS